MKKLYFKIFLLAIWLLLNSGLFLLITPLVRAEQYPTTLRVGLYDNVPKIWRDESGKAQGIFVDILNAIAEKEGWKLKYIYGTWDEGLERLKKNEIDIMPDVAWSEERAQIYDFNKKTVFINWGIIYSRTGIEIESIEDLEGKRIAVMKSGILYSGPEGLKKLLDDFDIDAEIIDVKIYEDVFRLLDQKKADAGVVNRLFGIMNEENYAVQRTNIFFNPSQLKFAFTKNAPKNNYLIGRIDENLKKMKSDTSSVYHKSLTKHLGGLVEKVEVFPRWFKYMVSAVLVLFAAVLGYLLILRAVRRRLEELIKAATKELKEEKDRFKLLFDKSNDALVLIDASNFKIIECNDIAWKVVGYSKKEDLIGKDLEFFSAPTQLGGRPTAEVAKELAKKVFIEGGATLNWICRHKNGADLFMLVTLTPIIWEEKKVALVSLRDITAQKLAEEKILALDRLKGRFITVLTHTTRTPLNRIRWSLETLMSGKFGKSLKKDERTLIQQALTSNDEILRMITNMNLTLDIERNALTLERQPTSLESLTKSVIKQLKNIPGCKDFICNLDLPDEKLPTLNLDATKMRQVIYELLDNARRFMADEKKK